MTSGLISIIIPVYNGEKFIKNCIESIQSQTYKNYEIIVVNDGSTDKTKEILDSINDKKMKVYNNKNKGVSASRNFGIEKSTGEYILFIDADDRIDSKTLQILYSKAKQNKTDIIRYNGYIQNSKKIYIPLEMNIEDNKVLNSTTDKELIISILNSPSKSLRCYSPLLFIKNDRIKIFDTKLAYLEDKVFYLENMLEDNKRILFIHDKLYYYNYNNTSKTKNIDLFIKNIEDILDAEERIIEIVSSSPVEKMRCDYSTISLLIYRLEYLTEASFFNYYKIIKRVFKNKRFKETFKIKPKQVNKFVKIQWQFLDKKMFVSFYLICKIKQIIKK